MGRKRLKEVGNTDGKQEAWCNHLHKHNECGKKQEFNYDKMQYELKQLEILYIKSYFFLNIVFASPVEQVFFMFFHYDGQEITF